jgi:hypothetical protein
VQCNAGKWRVVWWAVRELQYSPSELLLWEAGRCTGTVREPRVRGTSAFGSRYRARANEDTAGWEDLVRAVVNCSVCELAIALYLLVVSICKCSINPITNPNPARSHSHTWEYHFQVHFDTQPVLIDSLKNFCTNQISIYIYDSTASVDLGRFFSFLICTQSAGLLGRGISRS